MFTFWQHRNEVRSVFIVYLLVCLYHICFFWGEEYPEIIPDEVSYLAQAKYFAGKTEIPDAYRLAITESMAIKQGAVKPAINNWPHYHFGYSLLVTPIYWAVDDPRIAYRLLIIFNGLLISSIFIFIFYWLREITEIGLEQNIAISAVTSLYPAYTYHTYVGWAENAIIPFFALSVLLYTLYLKRQNNIALWVFCLLAGFLYTLHPRGIAFTLAAMICLFFILIANPKSWRSTLVGLTLVALVVQVTNEINQALSIYMKTTQQQETVSGDILGISQLNIYPILIGHFLYMVLSSLGMFLLGFILMFQALYSGFLSGVKTALTEPKTGVFLYVVLGSAALFSASVLFNAPAFGHHLTNFNPSIDRYLYGRYNEAAISVFIALGLYYSWQLIESLSVSKRRDYFLAFLGTIFLVSIPYFWYLDVVLSELRVLRSMHSPSLFPWFLVSMTFPGWIKLSGLLLGPALWMFMVYLASNKSAKKAVYTVGLYFILMGFSLISYNWTSARILEMEF